MGIIEKVDLANHYMSRRTITSVDLTLEAKINELVDIVNKQQEILEHVISLMKDISMKASQ